MDIRELRIHHKLTTTIENWLDDINEHNREIYYKRHGDDDYFDAHNIHTKRLDINGNECQYTNLECKYIIIEDYDLDYIPNILEIILDIERVDEDGFTFQYSYIDQKDKKQSNRDQRQYIKIENINYSFEVLEEIGIISNLEQQKLKWNIDNF